MMIIWKFMVLISILVWSASSVQNASAEPGAEPESAPVMKRAPGSQEEYPVTRRLESMTRRLGLSTEQQAEIRPILLDAAARLKELRADGNQTTDEKKVKIQKLRDETDSRIRPALTAEQQNKHDALQKNISEHRKDRESKGSTVIPARQFRQTETGK